MDYPETCHVGIRQVSEFFFTLIIFSKKIINKKKIWKPAGNRCGRCPKVSRGFWIDGQHGRYQQKYSRLRCFTCSRNITLSLHSYIGSALKRELNFCNGYRVVANGASRFSVIEKFIHEKTVKLKEPKLYY